MPPTTPPTTWSTDVLIGRVLVAGLLSTVAFFDSFYIAFPGLFKPTTENNGMLADVLLGVGSLIASSFIAFWLSQPYWSTPKPPEEREHGW